MNVQAFLRTLRTFFRLPAPTPATVHPMLLAPSLPATCARCSQASVSTPHENLLTAIEQLRFIHQDKGQGERVPQTAGVGRNTLARARDAVLGLQGTPHRMSMSDFTENAYMFYVVALEHAYNNGQRFPIQELRVKRGRKPALPESKTTRKYSGPSA